MIHDERFADRQTDQIDGIKIDMEDEWVLVLPDPETPFFNVIAEAGDLPATVQLCEHALSLVSVARTTSAESAMHLAGTIHLRLAEAPEEIRGSGSVGTD